MVPADIEKIQQLSDTELYEEMARCESPGNYQICVEELQRRFLQRVEVQVNSLADSSGRMENLTKRLNALTVALLFLTLVQLGVAIWSILK